MNKAFLRKAKWIAERYPEAGEEMLASRLKILCDKNNDYEKLMRGKRK